MRNLCLLTLIFMVVSGSAQKYGDTWHFGNQIAIHFHECQPALLPHSANVGFEGVSCISDSTGQVLCYTNSDTLWNAENVAMPNGDLVSSSGSLSQVLIVNAPQSDHLYYIITTKIQASGSLSLQYHVADMNLENGLGDVISKNNVMWNENITEQIAATRHANGTDIWLMTHEYGTNNFLAFLLTQDGIADEPVISSVGGVHVPCNSNINSRGEIKFSPDATRLAMSANGVGQDDSTNMLMLCDFDAATGIVSNVLDLPFSRGDWGLSFSPGGTKLYGATWKAGFFTANDHSYLYQFDLTQEDIAASRQVIDSTESTDPFGSIKIGPDGRVYVARATTSFLGVIHSPDEPGAACDYVAEGFNLGGQICMYGLNNYIEYSSYCNEEISVHENNAAPVVSVYPSPAGSQAVITLNGLPAGSYTMTLCTMHGQQVDEIRRITGNRFTLERGSLPTGVYVLRISNDRDVVITQKVVFN